MSLTHSSTLPNRSVNSSNIIETIHTLLTERECSIFDDGLSAYHKRKDVNRFVESLSLVLNTNTKRQLLVPIRNTFIKPSDLIKFNDLSIKYGIALPVKGTATTKKASKKNQTGPKVIEVRRDLKGEWGFSIRGGVDHGIGIYISWVNRESNAEKAGLKIGDYIHRVNDIGLDGLTFAQATQVFRNHIKVNLVITSFGRIPGFQFANKTYRWVDREGRPVLPPTETESLGMTASGHIDPFVRKVNLNVESGQELGISIRGGAEHGLAIYISGVDPGSVAEVNGIKRGEQILEVNEISYINILHPDAAKGLKEQRNMVMRLKDVGKLPHTKIQPWQQQQQQQQQQRSVGNSVASSQPRSPPAGTISPPPGSSNRKIFARQPAEDLENGTPVMLTKRAMTPAHGIMNEIAQTLLTKPEMTTFTYYITRYEHKQIEVQSFVESLLKLFNTSKKMNLISEVRNVIREPDLDLFNELTLQREIQAFRENQLLESDGDFASVHAMNGARPPPKGFEERDDDSLDEVPSKFEATVPVIFHAPPPPPRGPPSTSTPNQHQIITETMKDRRLQLHESTLDDESWDESTLPRLPHNMIDDATLQRKLQEAEEKAKAELEAKLKEEYEQELEAKLAAEKEAFERQQAQSLGDQQRQFQEEKQALEKQMKELQEKSSEVIDKDKLEEEIWRQAEDSLRQDLADQIEKQSQQKIKQEYERKLEESLAEERSKTDAERRKREELERKQRDKNIVEREKEEQLKIEIEDRIRHEAEDRARREYEQRLQRESEEKARLAEEVKSYRSMKSEIENERDEKERLEKAKRKAEQKFREEEEEKERLEQQLKKEKQLAKEKSQKEAEEKERLQSLLEEKERELRAKERQQAQALQEAQEIIEAANMAAAQAKKKETKKEPKKEIKNKEVKKEVKRDISLKDQFVLNEVPIEKEDVTMERTAAEETDDIEEWQRMEEEELRKQEEDEEIKRQEEEDCIRRQEEQELRLQEEENERLRIEAQREEERRRQEQKKAQQEKEKQRRQQERDLARQAEEERLRRLHQEEEQRLREEEEERQRQKEEEQAKQKKEEKRISKEGSFFDPALMDDLVMDIGTVSAPSPTGSGHHVTFAADQKGKEQKIIENERKLAEQMLAVRLREKKKEKKEEGRFSFAGYTNLKGELKKVTVSKVNRKLGIAVDGGSNTRQKAVIVRQVVPDGSAALSSKGLEVGQQILAVNGKSLKGLKHKDAVMAIKNAFDGPMQKVLEFDMLVTED